MRGCQHGPHPSIQPEKQSFEGCLDRFWPYWQPVTYPEVLFGFIIRILYTTDIFSCLNNLLEAKINGQLGMQMFVYVLLTDSDDKD